MSKQHQTNREESGRLLQGNVKRLNERNYQVKSSTRNEIYKILITSIGWVCSLYCNGMYISHFIDIVNSVIF
jgi:hypothetical protein